MFRDFSLIQNLRNCKDTDCALFPNWSFLALFFDRIKETPRSLNRLVIPFETGKKYKNTFANIMSKNTFA